MYFIFNCVDMGVGVDVCEGTCPQSTEDGIIHPLDLEEVMSHTMCILGPEPMTSARTVWAPLWT